MASVLALLPLERLSMKPLKLWFLSNFQTRHSGSLVQVFCPQAGASFPAAVGLPSEFQLRGSLCHSYETIICIDTSLTSEVHTVGRGGICPPRDLVSTRKAHTHKHSGNAENLLCPLLFHRYSMKPYYSGPNRQHEYYDLPEQAQGIIKPLVQADIKDFK